MAREEKKRMVRLAMLVVPGALLVTGNVLAARPSCWMTGGGSIYAVQYGGEQRITHGFVVHCVPRKSDNLQVNDHGTGWSFHLGDLTSAICLDDPSLDPNPPGADFDTFVGEGNGICRNTGGESRFCTVQFTFTDGGEIGGCVRDTAIVNVRDENDNLLVSVSGQVDCGNHQAHTQ